MSKKSIYTLIILLISFSIYCALTVGEAWDERYELLRGKTTLDYFFSLGKIDNHILYREFNSTIYYTLLYFLTTIFPSQYQIEISHLINSSFSILSIFGIRKICKELFNYKVGNIAFLIIFFYPVFFGHMAFNSKDTILAFCHVWIFYFILKYIKDQNKANHYVSYIAILSAMATGIKFVFLGSFIPIFIFLIFDIFYFKKLSNKNFNVKKFIFDVFKCFIIFYIFLIAFWIDAYPNIFSLPFEIISNSLDNINKIGWAYNLINGSYYTSYETPKTYLLLNFLFKSPEYILFLYAFFFYVFIKSKSFFDINFKFFSYKLIFIIMILLYVNLVVLIVPYPIYDGLRLFLWVIPYFCIIPALGIYFLIENFKLFESKLVLIFLSTFIIYFLFNFLVITPYQYTYLNLLNVKNEFKYKKFENDYWGSSIKELIKNTNLRSDKLITFTTCGVEINVVKNYLKKNGYKNFKFEVSEKADFVIMTNRTVAWENKITNCFEKHKGINLFKVERNGLILSVVRKNNLKI